jgi:hypothetical protein
VRPVHGHLGILSPLAGDAVSALEDFPRELSLRERRGQWVLSIRDDLAGMRGAVETGRREDAEAVAEVYAAWRRARVQVPA